MTDDASLDRRTLMGALAAAGITAGTNSAAGDRSRALEERERPTAKSVADYASRAGRVNTEGQQEAFQDYQNGVIDNELLNDVIEAWKNGERVVEKDVKELSSNVEQDTTLQKNPDGGSGDAVVHQVTSDVNVNAVLTIEAGAVVEFTQESGFDVDGDGAAIVANGTSSSPILMTSARPERGWHNGVTIDSSNRDNKLEHVTIEYGGRNRKGVVHVTNGTLELSNCTCRRGEQYGLYLSGGTGLQDGSGENEYTYNTQGATYARTGNIQTLSASSRFKPNDRNYAYVEGNQIEGAGADSESRTWASLDVPYLMDGKHRVKKTELTIEPGATFEFTENATLNLLNDCRYTIVGRNPDAEEPNIADPITFTGTEKQRGWWKGIYTSSDRADNTMQYAVVEYAGNGREGGLSLGTGFRDSAVCQVRNCIFRHVDGFGMATGGNEDATGYTNNATLDLAFNRYTKNSKGPVRIHTSQIQYLDSGSVYTGNDVDEVYVANGENANAENVETDAVTWSSLSVPYHMNASEHWVNLDITIEPGAEFRFAEEGFLGFNNDAVLTVEGTEDDPILFTGTKEQRGWWDGIYSESSADENTMRHAIVEYGGNGEDANLSLGNRFRENAELALTDCTFRHSAGYGMITSGAGSQYGTTFHELDRNVYTKNADGPVSLHTSQVHYLSADSVFTGNDTDRIYVGNGQDLIAEHVESESVTWSNVEVPLQFADSRHNINEVELVIDPGVECQFEEQARVRVKPNGTITWEGTAENPITLTGTEKIAGWWDGIMLHSPSLKNVMSNVIIEYGGRGLAANIDMAETGFRQKAGLQLRDSTIRNSRAAGLFVNKGSRINSDVCDVNTFADNAGGDCVVEK